MLFDHYIAYVEWWIFHGHQEHDFYFFLSVNVKVVNRGNIPVPSYALRKRDDRSNK